MAKRNLACGLLLAAIGLPAASALSQPVTEGGCAALAGAVRATVVDVLSQRSVGLPAARAASQPRRVVGDEPQACGRTALVTSRAFTETLANFSLSVTWPGGGEGQRGDACLSHYLDQCYPGLEPGMPIPYYQYALVADAWQGVAAGVRQQMPFGAASDISWFRAPELYLALAISLDATVDGAAQRRARHARESRYRE